VERIQPRFGPGFFRAMNRLESRDCRFHGAWWCGQRAKRGFGALRMWLTRLRGVEGTAGG